MPSVPAGPSLRAVPFVARSAAPDESSAADQHLDLTGELEVLVDADNVTARRVQPVLDVLAALAGPGGVSLRILASGRPAALQRLRWPEGTTVVPGVGWQRADVVLAEGYRPRAIPLVLISGDGDFAHLARRHPGPVLVISSAAAGGLRDGAVVVDPARDGIQAVRRWLSGVLPSRPS